MDNKIQVLQKLKPAVPKRVLLLLLTAVWGFAGAMLLTKGIGFLQEIPEDIIWKSIVGSITGLLFFRFIFLRITTKHIHRIKTLPIEKPCLFSFLNKKSYLLMISMISLGIFLKATGIIPNKYLVFIYLTIGISLVGSAIHFFIAFWRFGK